MASLGECCKLAHLRGSACENHGNLPAMLVAGVDVPSSATHHGAPPLGTLIPPPGWPNTPIAASTAKAASEALDPTAFHLMCLAQTIDADIFVASHRGEHAEHDLLQEAQSQLAVLRSLVDRARSARTPEPTNG